MNWPTEERWLRLVGSEGETDGASHWYALLTAAYSQPHRYYHNQRHLADCFAEFEEARHLASNPKAVEFALWFHDAVYNPQASDNEERSASLAAACLNAIPASDLAPAVCSLVMATKTHETTGDRDAALLIDVDLSILGQNAVRFAEYAAQIRQEYSWVNEATYNRKRAEILQGFLGRPHIFTTEFFAARYERIARENLTGEIRALLRHNPG